VTAAMWAVAPVAMTSRIARSSVRITATLPERVLATNA
jgi:hypothetical protein